jgi:inorganic pyrophosphatase
MLQRSKIIRSRDEWKLKAVQRAEEIREHRKTQQRYRQKITQLHSEIRALEQTAEVKKTHWYPPQAGIWLT